MNRFSTNLNMLHTGGGEELYGDHHATTANVHAAAARDFTGVRRKRYLVYLPTDGQAPTILYGTGFATEYDLSGGSVWTTFDLQELAIPMGGYYMVANAVACWESDVAYA
jgi:hypothetical protein